MPTDKAFHPFFVPISVEVEHDLCGVETDNQVNIDGTVCGHILLPGFQVVSYYNDVQVL